MDTDKKKLLQSTSHPHLQLTSPTLQEDEFDFVLSQCTDTKLNEYSQPIKDFPTVVNEAPSGSRFRQPITDAKLQHASNSKEDRQEHYVVDECMERMDDLPTFYVLLVGLPPHLLLCTPQQLDYWISKFILEVRKADGSPYPPKSLHQIVCGIQRYVHEHQPAVNFLKDAKFAGLRRTLDSEMKRLRAEGHGVMPRRAEPLTVEEENQLWQCRLLREHSPQALLHTVLFLCGMYFALCMVRSIET